MSLGKLQATADMNALLHLVKKWKAKSKNKEIKDLEDIAIRIFFYINQLELEQYSFDKLISEARNDKLRAITRARKTDTENEKLRKQNESLSY